MATRVRMLTVTDLHLSAGLYCELRRCISIHRPDVLALVVDFLDAAENRKHQLSVSSAAEELSRSSVDEVVFVRGNHEDTNWSFFKHSWTSSRRRLVALHGELCFFGPAAILGFPCCMGDDTAFTQGKQRLPYDPNLWIPKLARRYGRLSRVIWLMHEPPSGTVLSMPGSVVAGSDETADAILRFSPLIAICGQDHQTPKRTGKWFDRLGTSLCINVGQTDSGPLHFTVVDAEFPSDQPRLPSKISISAFSWNETLELPSLGKTLEGVNN